jgi:hypothetical protein
VKVNEKKKSFWNITLSTETLLWFRSVQCKSSDRAC